MARKWGLAGAGSGQAPNLPGGKAGRIASPKASYFHKRTQWTYLGPLLRIARYTSKWNSPTLWSTDAVTVVYNVGAERCGMRLSFLRDVATKSGRIYDRLK